MITLLQLQVAPIDDRVLAEERTIFPHEIEDFPSLVKLLLTKIDNCNKVLKQKTIAVRSQLTLF